MATIIEASRPEDDKAWFDNAEDLPLEFRECDTCRAKSGSPSLCDGCLHNQRLINRLLGQLHLAAPPELQQACLMLLGEVYVSKGHRNWWALLNPKFEAIADVLRKVRVKE